MKHSRSNKATNKAKGTPNMPLSTFIHLEPEKQITQKRTNVIFIKPNETHAYFRTLRITFMPNITNKVETILSNHT